MYAYFVSCVLRFNNGRNSWCNVEVTLDHPITKQEDIKDIEGWFRQDQGLSIRTEVTVLSFILLRQG